MTKATELTNKQECFCKEYLIDLNATQAAIRAGYSEKTAQRIGSENLSKPLIQAEIQRLMSARSEKVEINAAWVLSELKMIHSLDILDIMNEDVSAFKPLSQWPKIWRTSISGMDIMAINNGDDIQQTVNKIKWPDKIKNLEMIGRHVSVKAWDKEEKAVTVSNNIMPVPVADSIDSWEEAAQKQQNKILGATNE